MASRCAAGLFDSLSLVNIHEYPAAVKMMVQGYFGYRIALVDARSTPYRALKGSRVHLLVSAQTLPSYNYITLMRRQQQHLGCPLRSTAQFWPGILLHRTPLFDDDAAGTLHQYAAIK